MLFSTDPVPLWSATVAPSTTPNSCSNISYTLGASSPYVIPPNPDFGLLNLFPLDSDFSDALVPSLQAVLQGPSSCSVFNTVSGTIFNYSYLTQPVQTAAWTQLCNSTGGNSSSLLLPTQIPSANSSVSVWFNMYQPPYNFYLFGCNSWTTAPYPSCPTVWLSAHSEQYRFKMVGSASGQFGTVGVSMDINQWTHVCVTYAQLAQQMMLYVNGALVSTVNDVVNSTTFGYPVLASTSVSGSASVFASFLNWRLYNITLPAATINYIYQQEQQTIINTQLN